MARDPQQLDRLARELAELTPEERARVWAEAFKRGEAHPPARNFARPTLSGGEQWIGGSLRREDLYGDDGR